MKWKEGYRKNRKSGGMNMITHKFQRNGLNINFFSLLAFFQQNNTYMLSPEK